MPATVSYDEQYCPIARALDVLGGRWTLLILRELTIGDQRFTDLRNHLPGIAPTLLTSRLRAMIDGGLVETKELPPPAARSVYSVTRRGLETIPVMRALAKWGMPLLEEPDDDLVVRPWTAVFATVSTYHDAVAAIGTDEHYEFRLQGESLTLSSLTGRRRSSDHPDVVFESAARVWVDIRQGRLTLDEAVDNGSLTVTGRKAALANFRRIFDIA
jgi:DNA-binding HxlR family transcriptional regulator